MYLSFTYSFFFFFPHCLQWMKKKQQKESLSTSMVEEGSLNRGLPHSANDSLASLLTFCSHFLFTELSCRISLPAFSLLVPLLVIASPSHLGKAFEVTYASLGSPLCPPSWTLVCNHFCLASSLLAAGFTLHPHSPKDTITWNKTSSCGCGWVLGGEAWEWSSGMGASNSVLSPWY